MKIKGEADKEYELCPAGNKVATCIRIIDLGTQKVEWSGQVKHQRKAIISWELPKELMADGRPFMISNRYTLSMFEKAKFRQHIESWRGTAFTKADLEEGFEPKNLIGKSCLLNLIHSEKSEKTYCNIASVSALPDGMEAPEQVNKTVFFSLDEFDSTTFGELPDWMKELISASPEYKAIMGEDSAEPQAKSESPSTAKPPEDEVPF